MGFILFLVSKLLSIVLYPLGFISSFVMSFRKHTIGQGLRNMDAQFMEIATSIDATGNVICEDLFNLCLIRHNGHLFGNRKETVSSVLGKNEMAHTLTLAGWSLVNLLNLIDENHCINSIDRVV